MSEAIPEKHLLAAVLVRAVRDLVIYSRGHSPEELLVAEAARAWIFDGSSDDDFTSFSNICLMMDLDCDRVRKQILLLQPDEMRKSSDGMWAVLK